MSKKFAIAIDIGTTTVALQVIDIISGRTIGSAGAMNAQRIFGADVTGRIKYCMDNGFEALTKAIREQIDEESSKLFHEFDIAPEFVERAVITGNTVMEHLAAGYSPVSMGIAPYTPAGLFGCFLPAWDTMPVATGTEIYYTPAVSAYVGGDVISGLPAAGIKDITETTLFIDIGTNGEMVLKHNNKYYCCATAAGPAFEGAGITMGMAAVAGAIDHVWQNEKVPGCGSIEYSVIGGAAPVGLCGSGLIDLLAVLLDTGDVDATGKLVCGKVYMPPRTLQSDISISVNAADIRALQLAKAAIAGGVKVLMHYAGINTADIKHLLLAGGFGSYLNPVSAARIGLIPEELLSVAKACGNTALEGAVMALRSQEVVYELEFLRDKCEYIELSSVSFFNDRFIEEMGFR